MCKIGDIIVVDRYSSHGNQLNRHSFVVLDDTNGNIQGVPYDFVSLVFSSFKSDSQKKKKLEYPGNFPIVAEDVSVVGNNRDGYVKAEQFYYFNKNKISYTIIGSMNADIFNLLVDFINDLIHRGIQFEQITDNL